MACHGSRAVQRRRRDDGDCIDSFVGSDDPKYQSGENFSRRSHKKGTKHIGRGSARRTSAANEESVSLRENVDPETMKYFTNISSLLENGDVDLSDRSIICSNALEETRGKELQLACDKIISRTVETLLGGCSMIELCAFLQSCAKDFSDISVDPAGSHVAEAAFRSLATHVQSTDDFSCIEQTLSLVCQVLAENSAFVMTSCHGSHVLRSLLCLCKGIRLEDSEAFHMKKPADVLAERLNGRSNNRNKTSLSQDHPSFPDLHSRFSMEILNHASIEMKTLRVGTYSSLVFQTILKLQAGNDRELLHIIPLLLCCNQSASADTDSYIELNGVPEILDLLTDTSFSHLMEVVLEVAPDSLYEEILMKVFRGSLLDISSHHCGNFVVQALVSSARREGQVALFFEELGSNFKKLLKMRKGGVVASVLAACARFETNQKECCRALADAVCLDSDSSSCIVPKILFMENYFSYRVSASWKWPAGEKISVLGCLILQIIFRSPSKFIQTYVSSITMMEPGQLLETAKDAGGGRVIESFLSSDVSAKQKYKLIAKFEGHFGELALLPSGSFTVEKCFTMGSSSLKELIVSELASIQVELSRTKHGPHIIRKFDVARFEKRPDQWRSAQTSKQATNEEFSKLFGSGTTSHGSKITEASPHHSKSKDTDNKRKDPRLSFGDNNFADWGSQFLGLDSSMAKLGFPPAKRAKKQDNYGNHPGVSLHAEAVNKGSKEKDVVAGGGAGNTKRKTQTSVDLPNLHQENKGQRKHSLGNMFTPLKRPKLEGKRE